MFDNILGRIRIYNEMRVATESGKRFKIRFRESIMQEISRLELYAMLKPGRVQDIVLLMANNLRKEIKDE